MDEVPGGHIIFVQSSWWPYHFCANQPSQELGPSTIDTFWICLNLNPVIDANHEESETFACRRGIRQGCNLCPLPFSLFINDLDHFLTDNNSGSIELVQTQLHLLFADDLVLLASYSSELQTQYSINLLENFCKTSKLSPRKFWEFLSFLGRFCGYFRPYRRLELEHFDHAFATNLRVRIVRSL